MRVRDRQVETDKATESVCVAYKIDLLCLVQQERKLIDPFCKSTKTHT